MASKPRLLYILHQYDHLAGAELQTTLLAERMKRTFEVGIAWLDLTAKCIVLRRSDGSPDVRWPAEPLTSITTPESPLTERSFTALLSGFQPDIIHFQHLTFWPLSVIDQALATPARVVVTLHDHFALTPDYAMFGVADPRETVTAAYSLARFGTDISPFLIHRRQQLGHSLSRAHRVIAISDYLKRVMSQVFPLTFQVIEPGIAPFVPLPRSQSVVGVRFGFLGAFIRAKGMITLVEAFLKVRQRHPITQLNIYGGPAPRGAPPAGINLHGTYGPGDLASILTTFDVGVIPSISPETFSIVLSEMWQAGIPAAVSDIGALGERVQDGVNGRKSPPGDAGALAATMCWFIENDAWRAWALPKPRTADDVAGEHEAMYRSLW